MKITVVTPRYSVSGVPLAQAKFAQALANDGHDVELVIGRADAGLRLPKLLGVKLTVLGLPNVRTMFLPVWKHILKARPEIIFSAEDHLNAIVLLAAIIARSRAKVSCSSRVTPFDTYSNKILTKRWFLKQFSKAVMWRADALTCVSEDMVRQYHHVFNAPPHICIYNIVVDGQSKHRMSEPIDHPWLLKKEVPVIIAAGRLEPWKGFDDLIRAIKILTERKKVRLLILGEGSQRSKLEQMVEDLDLEDAVDLPGYAENPLKYFARADVFALSSIVEGLPNVLVEAMMCGCTPVSTDCPTGPREVLQGGKYGYLVPVRDPTRMAAGIERALNAPIEGKLLDEAIRPFKQEAVLSHHFQILGIARRSSADVIRGDVL
ncbi:glycosyltransferase [Mesorhizobium sp. M0959]|uniref:glycosyltransferase n=1 Tax=unclassified Mesorhizobium TaxID=325217 RepID=UPI00333ABF20